MFYNITARRILPTNETSSGDSLRQSASAALYRHPCSRHTRCANEPVCESPVIKRLFRHIPTFALCGKRIRFEKRDQLSDAITIGRARIVPSFSFNGRLCTSDVAKSVTARRQTRGPTARKLLREHRENRAITKDHSSTRCSGISHTLQIRLHYPRVTFHSRRVSDTLIHFRKCYESDCGKVACTLRWLR